MLTLAMIDNGINYAVFVTLTDILAEGFAISARACPSGQHTTFRRSRVIGTEMQADDVISRKLPLWNFPEILQDGALSCPVSQAWCRA